MPSLEEIVYEMLKRCPGDDAIGRVAAISSLTTTTIVSNTALNYGGNSEQRYAQRWAWRITTTTAADKVRQIDSYAPATGTLTHSGTNYTDTTATDENVVISNFEPYRVREAIDVTVRSLRKLDKSEYPSTKGQRQFWVTDDWIRQPGDIAEVGYSQCPVLSKDRFFDKWGQVSSAGVQGLDHWTLSGSGATAAKSTAHYWRGAHVVALTRVTNDAELNQLIPVYRSGVDGYDLRGKSLTFVAYALTDTASAVKIRANGGGGNVSDTHTGGETWELLTAEITVAATAESIPLALLVEDSDATGYFGEAYLVETERLSDAVRKNDYPEVILPRHAYTFDQWGTLKVNVKDDFNQLLVWSKRPYPGFDSARLISGAADQDETDAPLETVATGAIARLYRGRAESKYAEPTDLRNAELWEQRYAPMARAHQALPQRDVTDRAYNPGGLVPMARRLR